MRCLLLAFSLGIVTLQQQAILPSPWHAVCDGALMFTFHEGASHAPRRERALDTRYGWDAPVEGRLAPLD